MFHTLSATNSNLYQRAGKDITLYSTNAEYYYILVVSNFFLKVLRRLFVSIWSFSPTFWSFWMMEKSLNLLTLDEQFLEDVKNK
jgi:hypothetical protein